MPSTKDSAGLDAGADSKSAQVLRALFSHVGSNKIDEEQWRDMTLRGVGILSPSEIPEELEAEHIRFKHCEHFDKAEVAEIIADCINTFLSDGEYKKVRRGGSLAKRDQSDFLLAICEALENVSDSSGNCDDNWKSCCGFCLESSVGKPCDIMVQLPSGFHLHFWRQDVE